MSRTPSWLLREVPSGYNSEMSENTGRDLVLSVIFVKLVIFLLFFKISVLTNDVHV